MNLGRKKEEKDGHSTMFSNLHIFLFRVGCQKKKEEVSAAATLSL